MANYYRFHCAVLLALFFTGSLSLAQEVSASGGYMHAEEEASKVYSSPNFELGIQAGKLLPNKVENVTELMSLWGLRTAFLTGKGTYFELGATLGRSEGTEWLNGSASLRFDRPIETLLSYVYFGVDYTAYKPTDGSIEQKSSVGGHIGGGIMTYIADALWFRIGMKFNIDPGTSLYINAGFVFRFEKDPEPLEVEGEESEEKDGDPKSKKAKVSLVDLVYDK